MIYNSLHIKDEKHRRYHAKKNEIFLCITANPVINHNEFPLPFKNVINAMQSVIKIENTKHWIYNDFTFASRTDPQKNILLQIENELKRLQMLVDPK